MDLSPFIAAFMLSTEATVWTFPGNKEAHVRKHLDVTMVRYTSLLNRLIDSELGQQIDAGTCRRLRNIRNARLASRFGQQSA